MKNIFLYMAAYLSCAVVCFCLRFSFWIYTEYWSQDQHTRRHIQRHLGNQMRDRQGNGFTQADETGRDNRCNDIFFIEPNSQDAARIRAQLEKDDKELPSYDEVMRIANLYTPTAAPTANTVAPTMPSVLSMGASSSSVSTNDTTLTIPPYREGATNVRPLTLPPYTPEPIGDNVVLPITTALHSQQNTQNS